MSSGIYVIQNVVTRVCYVGSSSRLRIRKNQHFHLLRKGTHHSAYLQRSFNKHGEAAFKFWVAEECPKERLIEREQWWLDAFAPGYNLTCKAIPMSGASLSAEHKAKLSAAKMGKPRGPMSEEHRRNISKAHRARPVRQCEVAECGRRHQARGLCTAHYEQLPERKEAARLRSALKRKGK